VITVLDYLPLVVILGGLGVMAYFLTKSGKKSENKRAETAEAHGWEYTAHTSAVVLNVPDEERNILYTLKGKTAAGTEWEVTSRTWKTIEKSSSHKLELNPSTELIANKSYAEPFLIMPHDGITIPDFILAEIFKRLDVPIDTPRVSTEKLPEALAAKYAVYSFNPPAMETLASAAGHLNSWWSKFPGKTKALIFFGGPNWVKVRTEMQVDKEDDMVLFVETALSLIG
jgi:hypothetical protein